MFAEYFGSDALNFLFSSPIKSRINLVHLIDNNNDWPMTIASIILI